MGAWTGTVLRLPGGQVLLSGSALLDVVRALQAAQRVARGDGLSPPLRWQGLLQELLEAVADGRVTSPPGSEEVPALTPSPESPQDLIPTQEVALLLTCTPRNVRDLARREVLTSGRLVAGRLMFDRAEIETELMRRQEAAHTQTEGGARRAS